MTKDELVAAIAEDASISKKEAEAALRSVTARITGALSDGGNIALSGFGTFSVSERGARTGRNPKTGEAIEIAASRGIKFKPGKGLKDAVR